jgi:hypothetical protein
MKPDPCRFYPGDQRYPRKLLNRQPVDLLVVELGIDHRPPTTLKRSAWEDLVQHTYPRNRPRVVLETWTGSAQLWSSGPVCKGRTTVWDELGYTTRCRLIQATDVGGAIWQEKLVVARIQHKWAHAWSWSPVEARSDLVRPMSNLLTPPGLVPGRA